MKIIEKALILHPAQSMSNIEEEINGMKLVEDEEILYMKKASKKVLTNFDVFSDSKKIMFISVFKKVNKSE